MNRDAVILNTIYRCPTPLFEILAPLTVSELLTLPLTVKSQKNSPVKHTKNGLFASEDEQYVQAFVKAKLQNMNDFRNFAYYTMLKDFCGVPSKKDSINRGDGEFSGLDNLISDEKELLTELMKRRIYTSEHLKHLATVDISVPGTSEKLNMKGQYDRAKRQLLSGEQVYPGLDSLDKEKIAMVLHKFNRPYNKQFMFSLQRAKCLSNAAIKLATGISNLRYAKGELLLDKEFKLTKKLKLFDFEAFALISNEIIRQPHAENFAGSLIEKTLNFLNNVRDTNPYLRPVSGLVKNFYISHERSMSGLQLYVVPTKEAFDFQALHVSYPDIVGLSPAYHDMAVSLHVQAYTEWLADKIGPTSHLLWNRRKCVEREAFLQTLSSEASRDYIKWEDVFKQYLGVPKIVSKKDL